MKTNILKILNEQHIGCMCVQRLLGMKKKKKSKVGKDDIDSFIVDVILLS